MSDISLSNLNEGWKRSLKNLVENKLGIVPDKVKNPLSDKFEKSIHSQISASRDALNHDKELNYLLVLESLEKSMPVYKVSFLN
jgi:hypothetical protein